MSIIIEEETVRITEAGAVTVLQVNRPKSLNALNVDVLGSLQLLIAKLSKDPEVRAVIITGAGEKAFVAGADIATMNELGPRAIADYIELGQRTMRSIESARFPVIAAVNGFALGGGLELALACDLIVASSAAKVGQPEVNLGIIPGFGGTQRLVQRCGVGAARRLCYTGELIGAQEALTLGIVDAVVEPTDLMPRARAWAEMIGAKAPLAVAAAKRVINDAGERELLAGLRGEVDAFLSLFGSADREEGMLAFLQKRKANFTGR